MGWGVMEQLEYGKFYRMLGRVLQNADIIFLCKKKSVRISTVRRRLDMYRILLWYDAGAFYIPTHYKRHFTFSNIRYEAVM